MYLLLSCFITNKRHSGPNRYDRLDIFKYMLQSYSQINFEYVYLYVELDDEYKNRQEEFENFIRETFRDKVQLTFKRLLKQYEWEPIIKLLSESGEDKLVWFSQNDDHIFIDFNLDVLNEGLTLLKNDSSLYKALSYSHWPESVRISTKLNRWKRIGNYINFKITNLDGIKIFNLNFLKFLFIEYPWPVNPLYGRIDGLLDQENYGSQKYPEECAKGEYDDMLSMYVPLRELCRHFDGYYHIGMSIDDDAEFPALKLPPESNIFNFTSEQLFKRFYAPLPIFHPAVSGNRYRIPEEWEEVMLKLYEPVTIID